MKTRITLTLLFFFAFGQAGRAQATYSSFEIFGGYALSHQKGEANLNGWHGQAAFNLKSYLGIVADVSSHYMGAEDDFVNGIAGLSETRLISYSVGPRAYNRDLGPVSLFSHALFGQSRIVGHEDIGGGVTERRVYRPFTLTLGAGVDLRLADSIWLRIVEMDYRLLRIESTNSNGFRVSTGVNFTF